jgi:hypothetical protein
VTRKSEVALNTFLLKIEEKQQIKLKSLLRDFPLFYVCPTIKNCPSARCASAANVVCRDFDVFTRQNVSLEHILL